MKFGDVFFCGGRETGEPGEKPLEHGENQEQTQPIQKLKPTLNDTVSSEKLYLYQFAFFNANVSQRLSLLLLISYLF